MAPRETENNAYAKFWGDKQRALWYVMLFSGVVNYSSITMIEARFYGPARLSTPWPPKSLLSLKPLDAILVEVIVIQHRGKTHCA